MQEKSRESWKIESSFQLLTTVMDFYSRTEEYLLSSLLQAEKFNN